MIIIILIIMMIGPAPGCDHRRPVRPPELRRGRRRGREALRDPRLRARLRPQLGPGGRGGQVRGQPEGGALGGRLGHRLGVLASPDVQLRGGTRRVQRDVQDGGLGLQPLLRGAGAGGRPPDLLRLRRRRPVRLLRALLRLDRRRELHPGRQAGPLRVHDDRLDRPGLDDSRDLPGGGPRRRRIEHDGVDGLREPEPPGRRAVALRGKKLERRPARGLADPGCPYN